jgi:hypothetical protein
MLYGLNLAAVTSTRRLADVVVKLHCYGSEPSRRDALSVSTKTKDKQHGRKGACNDEAKI